MPKTTAIDRAIAALDEEILVLQHAKTKLLQQIKPKAVAKPTRAPKVASAAQD
jgi:hypothetical protein